jgi:seryl-tRNA synthetase
MATKNDTPELIAEQRYQKRLSDHHLSQQQKGRILIDTKSEIQENIESLIRRQNELRELRNSILTECNQLESSIKSDDATLLDRMGTGLEFKKLESQIEKDREKLKDLKLAIIEADQALPQLKAEQAVAEMNLARIDFNQLNDEADSLLANCIEKLEMAAARLTDYGRKIGQIKLILDAANPGTAWVNCIKMKDSIFQYLTDDGTHKLNYRLLELKNNYPKYLADCQSKRNKTDQD